MVLKSSKWFRNVQNGFEKFKMVLRIRNSFEKTHFKIVLGRNYIGIFLRSAGHTLGLNQGSPSGFFNLTIIKGFPNTKKN